MPAEAALAVDLLPRRYRVTGRAAETDAAATLRLEAIDEPIEAHAAGQFMMLYEFGAGEIPISVSAIHDDGAIGVTIRSVGVVSARIAGSTVGSTLGVRGPFGTGWDVDRALGRDVVVVAGGIGLAPVRPLVHELVRRRDEFGRVSLLLGARRPAELLFRAEVEEWASTAGIDVNVIVDAADPGWSGDVGLVTALVPRAAFDPSRATAFVCGPEVMMRFVARALEDRGMAGGDIRVSLERNMKCAVQRCGQCQLGPWFVCTDGPCVGWDSAASILQVQRW